MNRKLRDLPAPQGLYDPAFEHDACGIGFVVNIKGEKSYSIIDDALKILENLNHTTFLSGNARCWAFPCHRQANTA